MARRAQPEQFDTAAQLEQLLRDYYPLIRRLAHSILDDLDEAEDATQETFIAAHRSIADFRGESNPKTWLFSIAINTCRGRLRKRKVRQVLQDTLKAFHLIKQTQLTPEQATIQNELDEGIWNAVNELDEKHRLPVLLRYVQELSVADIATVLRLNEGTVHSRLHYARRKLHTRLAQFSTYQEEHDDTCR